MPLIKRTTNKVFRLYIFHYIYKNIVHLMRLTVFLYKNIYMYIYIYFIRYSPLHHFVIRKDFQIHKQYYRYMYNDNFLIPKGMLLYSLLLYR